MQSGVSSLWSSIDDIEILTKNWLLTQPAKLLKLNHVILKNDYICLA